MYTDTKNLAHDHQIQQSLVEDMHEPLMSSAAPSSSNGDSKSPKRKLGKVWRPLLRLLARKRQASLKTCGSIVHPNNVHLNNAAKTTTLTAAASKLQPPHDEWPTAMLEDYACVMRKISCKDECNHGGLIPTEPSSAATTLAERPCQASAKFTTVISSASIEKIPPSTCAHCVYGRNCQHEQYHHHACNAPTVPATTDPLTTTTASIRPPVLLPAVSLQALAELPLHYIQTDDGTFFWTSTQDKIDDDLLTAWLCQSLCQLPVPAALQM